MDGARNCARAMRAWCFESRHERSASTSSRIHVRGAADARARVAEGGGVAERIARPRRAERLFGAVERARRHVRREDEQVREVGGDEDAARARDAGGRRGRRRQRVVDPPLDAVLEVAGRRVDVVLRPLALAPVLAVRDGEVELAPRVEGAQVARQRLPALARQRIRRALAAQSEGGGGGGRRRRRGRRGGARGHRGPCRRGPCPCARAAAEVLAAGAARLAAAAALACRRRHAAAGGAAAATRTAAATRAAAEEAANAAAQAPLLAAAQQRPRPQAAPQKLPALSSRAARRACRRVDIARA